MFYKLQYNIGDDPVPHQRFFHALTPDTATSMFEATCEDGSLTGEHVTLLSVEPLFVEENPPPVMQQSERLDGQIG